MCSEFEYRLIFFVEFRLLFESLCIRRFFFLLNFFIDRVLLTFINKSFFDFNRLFIAVKLLSLTLVKRFSVSKKQNNMILIAQGKGSVGSKFKNFFDLGSIHHCGVIFFFRLIDHTNHLFAYPTLMMMMMDENHLYYSSFIIHNKDTIEIVLSII